MNQTKLVIFLLLASFGISQPLVAQETAIEKPSPQTFLFESTNPKKKSKFDKKKAAKIAGALAIGIGSIFTGIFVINRLMATSEKSKKEKLEQKIKEKQIEKERIEKTTMEHAQRQINLLNNAKNPSPYFIKEVREAIMKIADEEKRTALLAQCDQKLAQCAQEQQAFAQTLPKKIDEIMQNNELPEGQKNRALQQLRVDAHALLDENERVKADAAIAAHQKPLKENQEKVFEKIEAFTNTFPGLSAEEWFKKMVDKDPETKRIIMEIRALVKELCQVADLEQKSMQMVKKFQEKMSDTDKAVIAVHLVAIKLDQDAPKFISDEIESNDLDINKPLVHGKTPLQLAVIRYHKISKSIAEKKIALEIMVRLLADGAKPNKKGYSALAQAKQLKTDQVVIDLLSSKSAANRQQIIAEWTQKNEGMLAKVGNLFSRKK